MSGEAPVRQRIFDHLDGCPEDKQFSRVARAMVTSDWWTRVADRDEPAAVAGEVNPELAGAALLVHRLIAGGVPMAEIVQAFEDSIARRQA